MLAIADYYNCHYFWNKLSGLPQANPYNPAAWLQEAGRGTALPRRGDGVRELHGGHRPPAVCAPGVQSSRMGGRENRANSIDVTGLPSTLYSCSWLGWQLGEVNTYGLWRLLYIPIQSSFLNFIEIFYYLP